MGERGPRGRGGAIPAPELIPPGKPSAILLVKPGIVAAVTLAGLSGMVLAGRGLPKPGKAMLTLACILAAAGYTVLYTLVWKRRSPYGTIPGAVPGALPVLIGYAAVNPRLGMDGVLLFLILVLWQPPHFWALALRHQAEYRAAGIPVLPVSFCEPYTKALIFLYAAALLPLSLSLWALGYLSARFGWAAFLLGAGFLAVFYRDTVATRRFGRAFAASIVYLTLLLLSILADVLFG